MFRRVVMAVTAAFLLTPLCSVAQDTNGAPAQAGNSAPAQSSNSTPSQGTVATQAPAAPKSDAGAAKHSSSKKKKSKKVANPIANVDSKQPDKVLFDRALDAMKHSKYDVARLSLQTLINTYPDSEYVARAKLAIGDSWYAEGGAAAMAQAESEYKDFITFFPNMPEAAEAQMKIANIHFREMEKADRDPTHALRAEEEYRQMILQFPDSPLIPQAKERLLEVQEVLARREYMIGHFYYLRDSYAAAIARLKSVTDTYPLYSDADEALFDLGSAYEKQVDLIRKSKLSEVQKGVLIKQYTQEAAKAYDRILTRYPLEPRADDARKRLEALKQPVPKATPEAIAEDKREIASRGQLGTVGKVMENFHRGPDVSEATKVGEPTLVDPKQSSAPDLIRAASASANTLLPGHDNSVTVEKVGDGAPPAENAPVPRSDAAPDSTPPAATNTGSADTSDGAPAAGSEMKNDLAPAPGAPAAPPPPSQVNDIAGSSSSTTSQPAASASTPQQAPPANSDTESSSKKKKKKHLLLF
ncbi:MAG TPA: outer membrane protein assembly factor BamD [Terriglobales bacterium]|nr:outer membrane protein assembly factor BamD [Terriglobales bacterium]